MATYFNINYEFSDASALARIDAAVKSEVAGYICVADGNILQQVHNDMEYRSVVNGSLFSICDSSWVPMYLKQIHGISVSQYSGSRIFNDILSLKKYRMYFLGGSGKILDSLKEQLTAKYDERIAGMKFDELPFCDVNDFDYQSIAAAINADNPDIVWVSLGAPKQEIFMNRLRPFLKRGVIIAVGAVFKFYSGVSEKRAPQWIVRCHLEFLYRLLSSPKKQFIRCSQIIRTLPSIIKEEKAQARNKAQ